MLMYRCQAFAPGAEIHLCRPAKWIPNFLPDFPSPDMNVLPENEQAAAALLILGQDPPDPGPAVVPDDAFGFPAVACETPTLLQIGLLCRFYNHDMGIIPGDSHSVMAYKFQTFIQGDL